MSYKYISKADEEKPYDSNGVSFVRMTIDDDFKELDEYGIEWYRVNLKSGATYSPKLESNKVVLLMFNGKRAYINNCGQIFDVKEPAVFIPDFDKYYYFVGAIEDTEFMMGLVNMNDWDWSRYNRSHKHLPFFNCCSMATEYGQSCKLEGTHSWTLLQGMQLGHLTIGACRAIGSGTHENGHPSQQQWNYIVGNSDFNLLVKNNESMANPVPGLENTVSVPQLPGDFSLIYAGCDHDLIAQPNKEVFYLWAETYTVQDCSQYWEAIISNKTPSEAYEATVKMGLK
ncbi:MAG: hypothetical protein VB055_00835 [Oscillospiraceae bacterium]|nr:hypothetical protein [Oscillospiraceae bacterium]